MNKAALNKQLSSQSLLCDTRVYDATARLFLQEKDDLQITKREHLKAAFELATAIFGLSLLDVSSFSDSGDNAVLTAVAQRPLLYTLCSREGECGRLAHIIATFWVGHARFRVRRLERQL